MNGIAFDTLAAARALREAGFEDRQAEAPRRRGGRLAGVVRHAVGADRDTLATKADVAALRADLDTDIAALRADLDTGLATLRADIYRALWAQGAGLVAVMAALIAAFKLFG